MILVEPTLYQRQVTLLVPFNMYIVIYIYSYVPKPKLLQQTFMVLPLQCQSVVYSLVETNNITMVFYVLRQTIRIELYLRRCPIIPPCPPARRSTLDTYVSLKYLRIT